MEKLSKLIDLNPDGKRIITNYIQKFQEGGKTTKLENVEVVLAKLKRDIEKGRWSKKYGDGVNTRIVKGKKDSAAIAMFNQASEQRK